MSDNAALNSDPHRPGTAPSLSVHTMAGRPLANQQMNLFTGVHCSIVFSNVGAALPECFFVCTSEAILFTQCRLYVGKWKQSMCTGTVVHTRGAKYLPSGLSH